MTYAIVETSGKQLRVEPGRFYDVDRLALDVDDQVILERVLFVSNDGESVVGQPVVEGATVVGSVVSHLRGRKVIVYKMQPKKKTRKKQGHRQDLTRVMINSIEMNGKAIAGESASAQADAPAKAAVEAEAES
ncbi:MULTISPECIES: 50S ribosomal protein L21 [Cyanophyceae]|uniref:50S ribosomal protein L21 n=1 Tax=Cyanophyceae TaxID=3028117 RepID=UPI0016895596|nr:MULTISPECIES: 50S ribosomal protein L21 [Cyanophyceae]MBD1918006.1 50S ribosomal protein L21 [Phormidium sp. FACHB-77]MBD2029254.1 50S ribosomal protein L21 [Phormidium sp. FACHB-322]MBD2049786.1 50S ribosomal protein L21 [Leptolyngbya sp. FACHB-60]